MRTAHTPTPWTKGKHGDMRAPDGQQVTTYGLNIAAVMSSPSDEDRANSAFVIKAVNAHHELVEALQQARIAVAELCQGQDAANECWNILRQIDGALSQADAK